MIAYPDQPSLLWMQGWESGWVSTLRHTVLLSRHTMQIRAVRQVVAVWPQGLRACTPTRRARRRRGQRCSGGGHALRPSAAATSTSGTSSASLPTRPTARQVAPASSLSLYMLSLLSASGSRIVGSCHRTGFTRCQLLLRSGTPACRRMRRQHNGSAQLAS